MNGIGGVTNNFRQGYGGMPRATKATGTFSLAGLQPSGGVKTDRDDDPERLKKEAEEYLRRKYNYSDLAFKFRQETLTDDFVKEMREQGLISEDCYLAYAKPAWMPFGADGSTCNYRDPHISYQKFGVFRTCDENGNVTEHTNWAIGRSPDYEYAKIEEEGLPLHVSLEHLIVQIRYAAEAEEDGTIKEQYLRQAAKLQELVEAVKDIFG